MYRKDFGVLEETDGLQVSTTEGGNSVKGKLNHIQHQQTTNINCRRRWSSQQPLYLRRQGSYLLSITNRQYSVKPYDQWLILRSSREINQEASKGTNHVIGKTKQKLPEDSKPFQVFAILLIHQVCICP